MEKPANGVPTVRIGTGVLESPRGSETLVQTKKPMKATREGGASDRFYFSPKKEEKMEGFQRPPCKIFFEKEGQLYEAIQTVS